MSSEEESEVPKVVVVAEGPNEDPTPAASPMFTYRERVLRDSMLPQALNLENEFQEIRISSLAGDVSQETLMASQQLLAALELRRKYMPFDRKSPFDNEPGAYCPHDLDPNNPPATKNTNEVLRMRNGVMRVYESHEDLDDENPLFSCPTVTTFYKDIKELLQTAADGPTKSLAFKRLELLEARFRMHTQLNHDVEFAQQRKVSHRDFYNVRKVDNHVHLAACMNQKHLLRFIKSMVKKEPHQVVKEEADGKKVTLEEVFTQLNLTPYDLSIDHLDMHADVHTFQRFDRFNLKYNPLGQSLLRETFLKTDNFVDGKYMALVSKQVFSDMEDSKYQMAEYRVSIYGRSMDEWEKLAKWVVNHNVFSPNVRWMIQMPRLYQVYKSKGHIKNFQDMLDNTFLPLFEATRCPEDHPEIHRFLLSLVAFDSVDDESRPEHKMFRKYPSPSDWNIDKNPPYSYYIYYMYANLHVLNQYRKAKGLNMFALRPHCGESGDVDHLAAGFLTAQSIAHGLQLRKHPVLQYLFYLSQVGISMSPLSNNKLFLRYEKNPFPLFFARGLNVALSTDDPLQIHLTKEPLVEEYSIAAQVYRLSNMDLCEIAHNSVMQSGYANDIKAQWLGENWFKPFAEGNDMSRTNVPAIRKMFREATMRDEHNFLSSAASAK